jgi:hypothetical protein
MPRLMATDESMVLDIPGPGNFQFSAIRPEHLGATEYTLVTIVCDITGSVARFSKELREMIVSVVKGCQLNARAENILVRLVLFNSRIGIEEVHGFLNLSQINPNDYKELRPDGTTPLYDATYSSIGATLKYAETLDKQDFDVNGCVYIITDGDDNASTVGPNYIAELIEKATTTEQLQSLLTVLIGIFNPNDPVTAKHMSKRLDIFHKEGKLTQYIDFGDATPKKLAKLANLISESVSSSSQALADGVPSQPLTF